MQYNKLDKAFILPSYSGPFYNNDKIPRKLKKKIKKFCGIHYSDLNNGQRRWYYLEKFNPDYKWFIIKKMCEKYNN